MTRYSLAGRGPALVAVHLTMSLFAAIAFALRVYVRVNLNRTNSDDWIVGVGCLLFIAFCGCSIAGAFYGMGQHATSIPVENRLIILKLWYIGEVFFYTLSNMAVKLSISLMLLRIVVKGYQKKTIYILTGVLQVYLVYAFFLLCFQCTPIPFFWTRANGAIDGRCVDEGILMTSTYIYAVISLVFDWTMALLPWLMVRRLQLDLRTRIMVTFILGLGSIASVATIPRIRYISDLSSGHDFFYDTANLQIWSCLETGLSCIAVSAATLRPLFRRVSSDEGSQRAPASLQGPSTSNNPTSQVGPTAFAKVPTSSTIPSLED